MSSPYSYFRRRTIGRASSPPTWACYEQIHDDDDDDDDYSDSQSEEDSCSEDGEDYLGSGHIDPDSEPHHPLHAHAHAHAPLHHTGMGDEPEGDAQHMEIDGESDQPPERGSHGTCDSNEKTGSASSPPLKKDVKGKQRAVDPEPEPTKRRHRRRERRPTFTLRPILTIQKSQGFVWNQDLFVPPYIKDRYVASTSPPVSKALTSNSWSTTSSMTDYEVEVVEIRVRDDELYDIIP